MSSLRSLANPSPPLEEGNLKTVHWDWMKASDLKSLVGRELIGYWLKSSRVVDPVTGLGPTQSPEPKQAFRRSGVAFRLKV